MAAPKVLAAWARKNDEATQAWARDVVDPWARAAVFAEGRIWGDAEAAVLAREYPPLPGTAVLRVFSLIAWAGIVILLVVPTVGSAAIGLLLAVLGTSAGSVGAAHAFLVGCRFAFVIANVMALTAIGLWWELGRRRTWYGLIASAVTLCAAATTHAWLRGHADDLPDVAWLPILILSATLFGLVGLVLALLSPWESKGKKSRRKPPRRGPRGDKGQRCLIARHRLLEILLQRRLVTLDDGDKIRVKEMPLGYWCELDGLDEREWRRVLEYRHVGWREFDANDRKVPEHGVR